MSDNPNDDIDFYWHLPIARRFHYTFFTKLSVRRFWINVFKPFLIKFILHFRNTRLLYRYAFLTSKLHVCVLTFPSYDFKPFWRIKFLHCHVLIKENYIFLFILSFMWYFVYIKLIVSFIFYRWRLWQSWHSGNLHQDQKIKKKEMWCIPNDIDNH